MEAHRPLQQRLGQKSQNDNYIHYKLLLLLIIGASLSEPHTGQTASPAMFISMYRTSFRKCPRILIHWTSSILLSAIQFRKCHHVQIIETPSILHLQWATTSMCTLLVLLGQATAKSANYSYSELSYMSAKLYRDLV